MERYRIKLQIIYGDKLPMNYNYLISSWFYNTLKLGDENFGNFLHNIGYNKFKFFTFSDLKLKNYKIDDESKDKFILSNNPLYLYFSFINDDHFEAFKKGIMKNSKLEICEKNSEKLILEIIDIQKLSKIKFTTNMKFKTESRSTKSKKIYKK
jgi:CRISPR-associated endoribonuclease Cas6